MTEAPSHKGLYFNDPWVHYTEDGMKDGTIKLHTDPGTRRFKGHSYHGDMYFDVKFISKVDGAREETEFEKGLHPLWQGGCESNLILPHHIKHVVSLFQRESYIYEHDLRSELKVSMRDAVDQGTEQVSLIAEWVNMCRETGPVLVHCQAGLNRSALVVAKALQLIGFGDGNEIVEHLRAVRSPAVLCNPTFETEVRSWPRH